MAGSALSDIQTKVRRLTRTPDINQLSDADLNQYINTFVLYDLSSELRLFNLRTNLTFYTQPNVDLYQTNTTVTTDPLYNFKNIYIAVHEPVFIAGIQAYFTQNRNEFYGYFPQTNSITDTLLRGDGTTGPFSGILQAIPVLQNYVIFTCLDTTGQAMVIVDFPTNDSTGILATPNNVGSPLGTINYITGAFSFSFPNATQVQAIIYSETIPYQAGKSYAMLYYADQFIIRPVPDKVYSVQIEADIRPTELLSTSQSPDLEQWWQLVAYGASLKIFQDRMDTDSASQIFPEFQRQERMALRTTLTQQVNMRTQTLFTVNKWGVNGWLFGGTGWPY